MPRTRKNQGRDGKVANYKNSKKRKKSMEAPQFKPFRQVPHWEPDAKIELTGTEFSLLQNFFNVFAEPINIMQDIFRRNLDNETISIKYLDNEGKEVSKEQVQAYMEEVKKYLAAQAKATSEDAVVISPEGAVDVETTDTVVAETEPTVNDSKRKLKVAVKN